MMYYDTLEDTLADIVVVEYFGFDVLVAWLELKELA